MKGKQEVTAPVLLLWEWAFVTSKQRVNVFTRLTSGCFFTY